MALPESGISIPMVARELGTTENDLGRLCTHENINKWSKYKPVAFKSVNALTDTERASVDWGFRAFSYPTYQEAATSEWTYRKPMGGESEPFRLADFEGYNKDAKPFVTNIPQDVTVSNGVPHIFELGIDLNNSDFELIDFSGDIGSFYYGIVFVKGDSKYIQTAKFEFGLGEGSILVETTHPFFTLGGTIEANHILINQKIENFTLLSNIVNDAPTYMSLPTAEGVSNISIITAIPRVANIDITKIAAKLDYDMSPVTGYTSPTGNGFVTNSSLYLQLSIVNNSNQAVTLQNMRLSADPTYYGPSGFYFPADMYNLDKTPISSLYVPSGQSRDIIIGTDNLLNTEEGEIRTKPTTLIEIFSSIKVINNASTVVSSKSIRFASRLSL